MVKILLRYKKNFDIYCLLYDKKLGSEHFMFDVVTSFTREICVRISAVYFN